MNDNQPTVPRVAHSLDDLRVGQVVATVCADGSAGECRRIEDDDDRGVYHGFMLGGTVVILSDPPPEPVTVSRETFDRLAEALVAAASMRDPAIRLDSISYAARALVDEVRQAQS